MRDPKLGRYVIRQYFGDCCVPGHPLTEESRRRLKLSIRHIVRRAMGRHEPLSRLDQVIREIAASTSSETSSKSDADDADQIETMCHKILEFVVADVGSSERAEIHAFDTIGGQRETTKW